MGIDESINVRINAHDALIKKQQSRYTKLTVFAFVAFYLLSTILFASPLIEISLLFIFFTVVYFMDGMRRNHPSRGETIGTYRNRKSSKEV